MVFCIEMPFNKQAMNAFFQIKCGSCAPLPKVTEFSEPIFQSLLYVIFLLFIPFLVM